MVRRCFAIEGSHIMHRLYHILSREWSPQAAIHDDKNMVQPMHYMAAFYTKTSTNHILFSFLYLSTFFFNILFIGGSFKIVLN